MLSTEQWVEVCAADALAPEEAMRFDYGGRSFAVIRSPDGNFFAIDGHCSHEKVHLADGIIDGNIIECPKHFGAFDYRTGEARVLPACLDLNRYDAKIESGVVFIKI